MTFFAAVFMLREGSGSVGSATECQSAMLERMLDQLRGDDAEGALARSEMLAGSGFGGVACEVPGPVAQGVRGAGAAPEGDVFLDGYVGNRRALAGALGLPGDTPTHGVLWQGYLRWGIDGLGARLRGDYVLVVRDRRAGDGGSGDGARTWVLRDPLGARPLYWARLGSVVVMASSVAALFAAGPVSEELDPVYCGLQIQSRRHFDVRSTIYRAVRRLPGGSLFACSRGAVRERVFWSFDVGTRLVLESEAAYVERFLALLETAVARCCDTVHPLGLNLSGGLDSNLVLGVLGRLGLTDRLTVRSRFYPGWPMDESGYIRDAARFHGVAVETIELREEGCHADWAAVMRQTRVPSHVPWMKPVETGSRTPVHVVLNGEGGDEWFGGNHAYLAELLRDGKERAYAGHLARVEGTARRAKVMLGSVLSCGEPGFRLRQWRQARRNRDLELIAARVRRDPAYIRALRGPLRLSDFHSPVQRMLQDMYAAGWMAEARESRARLNLSGGQMARSPLNDLDLVAFSHALPGALKFGGEQNKALFRRLPDLLPPSILGRSDKAVFFALYTAALKHPQVLADLRRSPLVDLGWIEREALDHLVIELEGESSGAFPMGIWQAWSIWEISLICHFTNQ